MIKMRGTLLPLAISGLVGLSLAGCSSDDKDPAAAAEAPAAADPKTVLTSSVSGLAKGDYAFTAKAPGAEQNGAIDVETKSGSMKAVVESEGTQFGYEVRFIGTDRWMKMSVPGAPEPFTGKSWMHFDGNKVKGDAAKDLSVDASHPDMLHLTELVAAATTVKGDAKSLTGTIDGTKVVGDDGIVSAADLTDAGPAAAAIPFTAAVDDSGRLTSLELDMPATSDTAAGKWSFAFTGYGEQAQQEKPTGQVQEMPDSAYSIVNG
jgi:hypothetical protein